MLVLAALVLSGFAALVYEVVWVRRLGELFGHTAYAIQVVLAVFFTKSSRPGLSEEGFADDSMTSRFAF